MPYRITVHEGFDGKPAEGTFERYRFRARYEQRELTLQQLLHHARQGHAWVCAWMRGESKSNENFIEAQLLCADLDGDITLEAFHALPFVQRHCLATYTSPSHGKPNEGRTTTDRFRAIFDVGIHITDVEQFRELANMMQQRIEAEGGFKFSDSCGNKVMQLWYGNRNAEIWTNVKAGPLPWDWPELAAEEARIQEERRIESRRNASEVGDLQIRQAEVLLREMLPTSQHSTKGERSELGYDRYWMRVAAACASVGEQLYDAFCDWSSRGAHSGERTNRRRWYGFSRSHLHVLFELAKTHIGEDWKRKLAEAHPDLADPPPYQAPTRIAASFDARETLSLNELSIDIPGKVSAQQLAGIAESAKQEPGQREAQPATPHDELRELLDRLYELRAEGTVTQPDGTVERPLESLYQRLDGALLSEIMVHRAFLDPQRIERLLLVMLLQRTGVTSAKRHQPEITVLDPTAHARQARFLIDGWIPERSVVFIYGPAGCGKTQLGLLLAQALTGDPSVQRFADSRPLSLEDHWHSGRVMFIASDMLAEAEEHMISMMKKFQMIERKDLLDHLHFIWQKGEKPAWNMSLSNLLWLHRQLLQAKEKGRPYRAIFVDSLKATMPDDVPVGKPTALYYFRALNAIARHHGATVIYLHHAGKESKIMQGLARFLEEATGLIRLENDTERKDRTICTIEKIRSAATRTLKLRMLNESRLVLEDDEPEEDDNEITDADISDAILDHLAEHLNEYRAHHPTIRPGMLRISYEGRSTPEIQKALRAHGIRIGETKLRKIISSMKRDLLIEDRGHGRARRWRTPIHDEGEPPTIPF
jgi:KaiC/GvpD/RAD55 family RecA-like ATPase